MVDSNDPAITPKAIATLVLFIISIFFVIYPVAIPLRIPRKVGSPSRHIYINLSTAPILIIAILWVSRCIDATVVRDGIVGTDGVKPYNILILFFCLAYMAITLDVTGVLRAAAFWVSNRSGSNARKLFFYFYAMLTVMSVVIGNDPIILSATVFLVYYTQIMQLQPLSWLIAEFATANTASMVLFVGNPTNVVICEGFRINNVAFSAYTVFPFIACSISCFAALRFQFRSSNYIPKRLRVLGHLDIRSVLHDPLSAWVGGTLLACCLAVMLVVSFFGVDVWKITLPFAVAKFVFDMAWDDCKYRRTQVVQESAVDINVEDDEAMLREIQRAAATLSTRSSQPEPPAANATTVVDPSHTLAPNSSAFASKSYKLRTVITHLKHHFPTFSKSFRRLPFSLVPFAFSQFILIEGLASQGWIDIFAIWLVRASGRKMYPTVWLVGVLGVFLCNLSGTNIGATILLTKVMRAADLPDNTLRAGGIALAVASNIGAVSFTFSASLAGLLWRSILLDKGVKISQSTFAFWNLLPIAVMTCVGLAVVSVEMAVIY